MPRNEYPQCWCDTVYRKQLASDILLCHGPRNMTVLLVSAGCSTLNIKPHAAYLPLVLLASVAAVSNFLFFLCHVQPSPSPSVTPVAWTLIIILLFITESMLMFSFLRFSSAVFVSHQLHSFTFTITQADEFSPSVAYFHLHQLKTQYCRFAELISFFMRWPHN